MSSYRKESCLKFTITYLMAECSDRALKKHPESAFRKLTWSVFPDGLAHMMVLMPKTF